MLYKNVEIISQSTFLTILKISIDLNFLHYDNNEYLDIGVDNEEFNSINDDGINKKNNLGCDFSLISNNNFDNSKLINSTDDFHKLFTNTSDNNIYNKNNVKKVDKYKKEQIKVNYEFICYNDFSNKIDINKEVNNCDLSNFDKIQIDKNNNNVLSKFSDVNEGINNFNKKNYNENKNYQDKTNIKFRNSLRDTKFETPAKI